MKIDWDELAKARRLMQLQLLLWQLKWLLMDLGCTEAEAVELVTEFVTKGGK